MLRGKTLTSQNSFTTLTAYFLSIYNYTWFITLLLVTYRPLCYVTFTLFRRKKPGSIKLVKRKRVCLCWCSCERKREYMSCWTFRNQRFRSELKKFSEFWQWLERHEQRNNHFGNWQLYETCHDVNIGSQRWFLRKKTLHEKGFKTSRDSYYRDSGR